MKWRVGQHYGIHVYECTSDEASDLDRPIATFHTALDAVEAVQAHNLVEELSAPDLVHGYIKDGVWHETKDAYGATQVVHGLRNVGAFVYKATRKVYRGPVERTET